jgi:MacB-like periplasmic core domain
VPEAVAVLSYPAWQNRFVGDPEIIGKQIRLDGIPFTVVGVASRSFAGTMEFRSDVWVPFACRRPIHSVRSRHFGVKTMNRSLCWLLLLGWIAVPAALACRCREPGSTSKAYRDAQLVVRATVLSVEGEGDSPTGARARLRIEEAWKVETKAELVVTTRTTCAFDFEAGTEYLVYLTRPSVRSEWTTQICRGNLPVTKADSAVAWLRANAKKAAVWP